LTKAFNIIIQYVILRLNLNTFLGSIELINLLTFKFNFKILANFKSLKYISVKLNQIFKHKVINISAASKYEKMLDFFHLIFLTEFN
jgi:hypothetical protein